MTKNAEVPVEARQLISAVAEMVTLIEPQLIRLWRSNMTLSQRRLLRALRQGQRTAGQVAADLGISAPSLTRMLGKLEERGFVRRTVDPSDRRRVRVELTVEGREALASNGPVFAGSALGVAAVKLPPEQSRHLAAALRPYLELAHRFEEACER